MEKGILFGIGVGCGDPKDMTLNAIEATESCNIIAVPRTSKERDMVAYNIAKGVVNLEGKEILVLDMPMTKDKEVLNKSYQKAADIIAERLSQGENIAFLTLGDPTVYSTYIYVHKIVLEMGYETKIIPGITSFTASAAKLGISLGERDEAIIILPASYESIQEALPVKGTKVLMKSGRQMEKVKTMLKDMNLYDNAMMVERCSMEGEVIHKSLDTADENSSYFSLIIIKEGK